MIRQLPKTKARSRGLTVIEVLFAMVIVLVGLVGIAAMVPYAVRQAEDSYKISQALAAGDNALGMFNSHSTVQPKMDAPWLCFDQNANPSIRSSASELYQLEYTQRVKNLEQAQGSQATVVQRAVIQNEVIGIGHCIDPLFWGFQSSSTGAGNFSKINFPFYNEAMPMDYNPFGDASVNYFTTPRLRRVSLFDPNTTPANPFWLRQPSAIRMATVSGGDLIQANPDVDKSSAPLRAEYVDGAGALMQSPTSGASVSWLATVTPSDSTAVVSTDVVSGNPLSIAFIPEHYDLSVVVFAKRDVRDLNLDTVSGIGVTGQAPVSERLGFLNDSTALTPDSWNSGTFDIVIEGSANVDAKVKIGDWLMLSRNTSVEVTTGVFATRPRHKWYRVISVQGENVYPKSVRVAGEPWYYTQHELMSFKRHGVSPYPAFPPTAVTLLKDVVQVYQRSIVIQSN